MVVAAVDEVGYEGDIRRLDAAVAAGEAAGWSSAHEVTKWAASLYRRGVLVGDASTIDEARRVVILGLERLGPWPDFHWLLASAYLELHRVEEAAGVLGEVGIRDSVRIRALEADVAVQQGRFEKARALITRLVAEDPTWENVVRLASFSRWFKDDETVDALYAAAAQDVTAKEMQTYAWIEIQRGSLLADLGHFDRARRHVENARRAYPGYWLAEVQRARLLRSEGRPLEAIRAYEGVLRWVDKPELERAVGDLYLEIGDGTRANAHHRRALDGYLKSVDEGFVHYFGHLADYYVDVARDASAGILWARKDVALRANPKTRGVLAWALFRAGHAASAKHEMEEVLRSGVRTPSLLRRAAVILG